MKCWMVIFSPPPAALAAFALCCPTGAPHTPLFINEYGILGGGDKLTKFLQLVAEWQEHDIPLGGVGLQEHACERFTTALAAGGASEPERAHAYAISPQTAWQDLDHLAPDYPFT